MTDTTAPLTLQMRAVDLAIGTGVSVSQLFEFYDAGLDQAAFIAEEKLSDLIAHSPEWWAVHDVAQNIRQACGNRQEES